MTQQMIEAGDGNGELVSADTPKAIRTVTTAMPVIMDILVMASPYLILAGTSPAYCENNAGAT